MIEEFYKMENLTEDAVKFLKEVGVKDTPENIKKFVKWNVILAEKITEQIIEMLKEEFINRPEK